MADHDVTPTPRIIETSEGPIEFVDIGSGSPVLFIHGSPGGCDQGVLMARFLTHGHRVIASSRSRVPDISTPNSQRTIGVRSGSRRSRWR